MVALLLPGCHTCHIAATAMRQQDEGNHTGPIVVSKMVRARETGMLNITRSLQTSALFGSLLGIALLSGCAGNGGIPSLSFASTGLAGGAKKSEPILSALHGGVLPKPALATMSESDRLRALEAEYLALESAPGGLPIEWKSPDGTASGEVVAATPYQVGQQNCRQYSHEAVIRGVKISGRGAACRNEDGSWTPLG